MKKYEVTFRINPLERDFGGDIESVVVQAETMGDAEEKALIEIREMFPNSEPEFWGAKSLKS